MRRILVWLASLVLLAFALVAGLALLQPDRFRVERSIEIAAPPEQIFPLVEDFTQWVKWSPWEHLDPDMKRLFGNPFRGMGSTYSWSGNDQVGEGRMKMRTARLPNGIFIDLSFVRPWKAENQVEFKFDPVPAGTRVTWAMQGPQPFLARAMSLFVKPDAMIGPDFETGLLNLKREAEAEAPAKASVEAPVDAPVDAPADAPVDAPAEAPKSGSVTTGLPLS